MNNLQCGHKEGQKFPIFCEITINASPPTYWTQQSGQVQGNISEGRVPVELVSQSVRQVKQAEQKNSDHEEPPAANMYTDKKFMISISKCTQEILPYYKIIKKLSFLELPCPQKDFCGTLSHLKSFIELAVPPIRLFTTVSEGFFLKCLAIFSRQENVNQEYETHTAPQLLLLLFSAPRWCCCYLIFSSCNVKFPR